MRSRCASSKHIHVVENQNFPHFIGQDGVSASFFTNHDQISKREDELTKKQMHAETSTNLYGVTTNPYNRQLTAGGSSGGEGALLGLRGSCLGIGSDIGKLASMAPP